MMNKTTKAQLDYLQYNHPILSAKLAAKGGMVLDGMGNINLDLGDSLLGEAPDAVALKNSFYAALDAGDTAGASQAASALTATSGAATVTALYNLYRINRGKEPVSLAKVLGEQDTKNALTFLPWAIGGALLLWAASSWIKR